MRTPEERNARKQRILQMGKLRYILIFGVLGSGFAYGLGISLAVMVSRHGYDWGYGATRILLNRSSAEEPPIFADE